MASDFFESGGDSLKAVRIVAFLRMLHREYPGLHTGKGFSALLVTNAFQQHTPACCNPVLTLHWVSRGTMMAAQTVEDVPNTMSVPL